LISQYILSPPDDLDSLFNCISPLNMILSKDFTSITSIGKDSTYPGGTKRLGERNVELLKLRRGTLSERILLQTKHTLPK
jgi:hypothetical protein